MYTSVAPRPCAPSVLRRCRPRGGNCAKGWPRARVASLRHQRISRHDNNEAAAQQIKSALQHRAGPRMGHGQDVTTCSADGRRGTPRQVLSSAGARQLDCNNAHEVERYVPHGRRSSGGSDDREGNGRQPRELGHLPPRMPAAALFGCCSHGPPCQVSADARHKLGKSPDLGVAAHRKQRSSSRVAENCTGARLPSAPLWLPSPAAPPSWLACLGSTKIGRD